MRESISAMKKLFLTSLRGTGWKPWKKKWKLYMRTILMTGWNCLKERELSKTNGFKNWRQKSKIHSLGIRWDWLWRVSARKRELILKRLFNQLWRYHQYQVVLGFKEDLNLEIEQLDVKTIFFHSDLEEEIYMDQLEGFIVKGKEKLVCELNKSLYGLK